MEIVLVIALAALGVWWFALRDNKSPKSSTSTFDAPYKVESSAPAAEPTPAPAPAWHTAPPEGTKPAPMPNPLDVNGDGRVNMEDAKAAVKKARTGVKKAVAGVKKSAAVTKTPAKKAAPKTAKSKK